MKEEIKARIKNWEMWINAWEICLSDCDDSFKAVYQKKIYVLNCRIEELEWVLSLIPENAEI